MSMSNETAALARPGAELRLALEELPSSKRLSFDDTEAIYSLGYSLVAQGHYAAALKYFFLLTFFRPTEARYLAGQGLCYQGIGRPEEAIGSFAFAATLEPEKPEYMLAIAECELLKKDHAAARETLEAVSALCREKGGLDRALERAEGMLALLAQGERTA